MTGRPIDRDEADWRERVKERREELEQLVEEGCPGDWAIEAVLEHIDEEERDG